jgi:tetratricopeptide (TPR) repeat protein
MFYAVMEEACLARSSILRALGKGDAAAAWERYAGLARPDADAAPPGEDPLRRFRLAVRLAEAQRRSGRPREAIETLSRAVESAPGIPAADRADAAYGLAMIHRDLGEDAAMRDRLREVIRLDPNHPRAEWIRSVIGS